MTKINCGHWLFGFRMVCVCMGMWIFWWKKGQSSANIYIYIYDIYNTHVDYLFWLNCFRNEILYFKYFSFWICIKEIITGSVVVNCNVDTQISHCFIIYNKRMNIWKNNIFTIDLKCHKRKISSIRLISHSNEGISREIVEVYLCLQL